MLDFEMNINDTIVSVVGSTVSEIGTSARSAQAYVMKRTHDDLVPPPPCGSA